jgi:hypothetical protein
MKYLFTFCLLMTIAVTGHSQWWFDAGVKGAFGPTLMYDDNVFDSGTYKHKLTTGTSIGGRLGFNYGYHAGLSLEYNSATSKQDFEFQSDPFDTYKWKHNDIAAVFRYSGNGAYVEIGGKFSNIKSVEQDNVDTGVEDVSEYFSDNYTSGILGFGSYLAGSELLTLNLGIRLHWAFNDMVNEAGKYENFPIRINSLPDPSKKTLATAAQLQVELNYAFGRFAKTACSDRWKLLLFQ